MMHDDQIALYQVQQALKELRTNCGRFGTAHEGVAVLWEAFEELKAEIWKKNRYRDVSRMRREAIQVAVVAVRFCSDLTDAGLLPGDESNIRSRVFEREDAQEVTLDELRKRMDAESRLRDQTEELRDAAEDKDRAERERDTLAEILRELVPAEDLKERLGKAMLSLDTVDGWADNMDIPF